MSIPPLVSIKSEEQILVVDDDKFVLDALVETLKREGYSVLAATSGESALETMKNKEVALVICDQRMEGLSGIEVFKEMKELYPDTIRLLLTGNGDQDTAIQAINIGQVNQYIQKPWDDVALRQTVNSLVEKYRLQKENERLQKLILAQHRELEHAHASLQYELKLGAQIHEQLLKGGVPQVPPGFDIAVISIPSKQIDGDFYEFYYPATGVLDFVLGDVMGKGIPAALVGTALKSQLIHYAMPHLRGKVYDSSEIWSDDLLSPEEIVQQVHHIMVPKLIHIEYFCSLLYGRFCLDKHLFQYVDCGSPRTVYYDSKKGKVVQLRGENFPLGVVDETEYKGQQVSYSAGDCFVFFSDGVTECRSERGELFGIERVEQVVLDYREAKAEKILYGLRESIFHFCEKENLDDDLTLIVIKVEEILQPNMERGVSMRFASSLSQAQGVRQFIDRMCKRAPGNVTKLSSLLQLAVTEVFSNIVKHSYPNNEKGIIVFSVALRPDGVSINISDQGRSFDPSLIQEPNFTGEKDTGFGWFMIKKIVDYVIYNKKQLKTGWNHLSIFKKYCTEEDGMKVSHINENGIVVIKLESEHLDAKQAIEFKSKVLDIISRDDSSKVIFDLQHLTFIDSSGLGSFLSILRTLHLQGGDLKLASMNSSIRAMFELVSMHKIFEIFNTVNDAVESFSLS